MLDRYPSDIVSRLDVDPTSAQAVLLSVMSSLGRKSRGLDICASRALISAIYNGYSTTKFSYLYYGPVVIIYHGGGASFSERLVLTGVSSPVQKGQYLDLAEWRCSVIYTYLY